VKPPDDRIDDLFIFFFLFSSTLRGLNAGGPPALRLKRRLRKMSDDKSRLEQSLRDFDARHDEFIRKFSCWVGRVQRFTGGNPVGRWIMTHVTTRIAAWAIVRYHVLSIARPESGSAIDIALEWQKLALFMRVPIEIESADDNRVVIIHPECSVGFHPGETKVCTASMNMDHEIVHRLGGRLITTDTLTAGCKHCRHIVERI
jgi:hypothetical protein